MSRPQQGCLFAGLAMCGLAVSPMVVLGLLAFYPGLRPNPLRVRQPSERTERSRYDRETNRRLRRLLVEPYREENTK